MLFVIQILVTNIILHYLMSIAPQNHVSWLAIYVIENMRPCKYIDTHMIMFWQLTPGKTNSLPVLLRVVHTEGRNDIHQFFF